MRGVKLFATALLALGLSAAFGQATRFSTADLALGPNGTVTVLSLAYTKSFIIKDHIWLGIGLRGNQLMAGEQTYFTAPAKYTMNDQLDEFKLGKASTTSLSIKLHLGGLITEKIGLGFNIDALGISFGPGQTGTLTQMVADPDGSTFANTTAKPTSTNVLLVGDNDIGSLNSEFFLYYKAGQKLGFRAGLSMFFSEYTTQAAGFDGNQRFRSKISYPFVSVGYHFNK
ncbi:MAG: hypothetical protein HYZ16_09070 [Bacteroidetes bacterium]|nr:hypothetical protein [Bacteroidota bacterium]